VQKAGDKPTTWSGGFSVVMPRGAKNPDGAWEFMKYVSGEPGQLMYTKVSSGMPTLKSLLAEKSLFPGDHAFFVDDLLPITRSRPPLPVGALYWDQLEDAIGYVQLNTKQPMPALKAVAAATNPQLKQFCPI
jgi:ABC-type glycerol-3-phosphate transport system substrate-binding protein